MAPPALRYFADESILGLGKALARLRRDVVHPGHPAIPEVPLGALDTEWIPIVGSRQLIVIARDRHMKTRSAEADALIEHEVRGFWIGGKRDLSSWDWMRRLVRYWDRMEALTDELGRGPWFVTLNESGPSLTYHHTQKPRSGE